MNAMSALDELRSWLWIVPYWILSYSVVLLASIGIGVLLSPSLYWIVYLVAVPLLTIPIIYRNLVGGGCNLRFQICTPVKGTFVGMLFFIVSMLVDPLVWGYLQTALGWNALTLTGFHVAIYQIWFYSGFVGGIAARNVEVQGFSQTGPITVAGFEEI
jgi:hypothetical protein